jgi:hypothetical protein
MLFVAHAEDRFDKHGTLNDPKVREAPIQITLAFEEWIFLHSK